jgi:NAD(P)-dependent dehydrogenase (short-subunit alcohol dehydrogenase family)
MTNDSPVALLHGAGFTIGNEIAAGLAAQSVRMVFYDEPGREAAVSATAAKLNAAGAEVRVLPTHVPNADVVSEAVKLHGRLDYFFNTFIPGPETSAAAVFEYPQQLLQRDFAAAEAMAAGGAIVNQWYLGALYQGSPLESAVLMSKGAITGVTREICVKYGKAGVRINTIQLGLVDLVETKGLITEKTLARKTPVGRWGNAAEVAKFMLFLALKNGYMTGQTICFDGGLTAGNTGT